MTWKEKQGQTTNKWFPNKKIDVEELLWLGKSWFLFGSENEEDQTS